MWYTKHALESDNGFKLMVVLLLEVIKREDNSHDLLRVVARSGKRLTFMAFFLYFRRYKEKKTPKSGIKKRVVMCSRLVGIHFNYK